MRKEFTKKIGNHELEVTVICGRHKVFVGNVALTLGAVKKEYEKMLKEIEAGQWDQYIQDRK